MKLLATAWDAGSANAVAPVIKNLILDKNLEVITVVASPPLVEEGKDHARRIFDKAGIEVKTLSSLGQHELGALDLGHYSIVRLFNHYSPDIVLTGTSAPVKDLRVTDQSFVQVARERDIPSISVLDFWLNYRERFSDFGTTNMRYLPDKIAVMDEIAKADMLELGFKPEIIAITGNPDFDEAEKVARKFGEAEKREVRAQLKVPYGAIMVSHGSQDIEKRFGQSKYGFTEKDSLRSLLKSFSTFDNTSIYLVIRPHPNEKEEDFAAIIKEHAKGLEGRVSVNRVNAGAINTDSVILSSDYFTTPNSTLALKAAIYGIPVVSIQPGLTVKDDLITNRRGISIATYNQEAVNSAIKNLSGNLKYRKLWADKAKSERLVTGEATQNIVDIVKRALN